ncbi:MAG: LL-diaminopimelate aminotransferase [Alphaproteobacteria bacterium]
MSFQFHKIRRLPPYLFAEVNAMKAAARKEGRDIIDFGMGNPDSATPQHIVDKLTETVRDGRTHRYSSSKGIPGLRRAIAGYYDRRFDVKLDPNEEVVVTLGSKEGLANLAQAITSPGDIVLAPNPSYPIHAFGFVIAGASLWNISVQPDASFFAELERAVKHAVPPPTALLLSYPSNPTALTANLDFYRDVVAFCKRHSIFIVSDLAYSEIYFDGDPPPSILEVPGARDIAVEFGSLSKTYSMPGWRVGYGAGNRDLIGALTRVKSYLDYGAFTPIQVAATAALNGPQECVEDIRGLYRERRNVMCDAFQQAGWHVPPPPATMFAWAPIPEQFMELGSLGFSKLLLEEADVAVSPGVGFGERGEGFVRLAMVENRQRVRQAARGVKQFLARVRDTKDAADMAMAQEARQAEAAE